MTIFMGPSQPISSEKKTSEHERNIEKSNHGELFMAEAALAALLEQQMSLIVCLTPSKRLAETLMISFLFDIFKQKYNLHTVKSTDVKCTGQ